MRDIRTPNLNFIFKSHNEKVDFTVLNYPFFSVDLLNKILVPFSPINYFNYSIYSPSVIVFFSPLCLKVEL